MSRPTAGSLLVSAISGHKRWFIAIVIASLLVGYLAAVFQGSSYRASSTVFFSTTQPFNPLGTQTGQPDATRFLQQQVAIMTSRSVLESAAGSADEVTTLRQAVDVSASMEADNIVVRATGETPREARERLSAVLTSYSDYQESVVVEKVQALSQSATATERQQLQRAATDYGDGVLLVEPALLVEIGKTSRNVTVYGALGVILAALVCLLLQRSRTGRGRRAVLTGGYGVQEPALNGSSAVGAGAGARH